MALDQQRSLDIAAKRRRQLLVLVGVAILAWILSLIAVIGGFESAFAILVVLTATFIALILDLRAWRGAAEIWAGRADPARLRNLTLSSLVLGLPGLVAMLIAAILVTVRPAARLIGLVMRHLPVDSTAWTIENVGAVRWTDPVVAVAAVAAVVASAGAVMLALRVRTPPLRP